MKSSKLKEQMKDLEYNEIIPKFAKRCKWDRFQYMETARICRRDGWQEAAEHFDSIARKMFQAEIAENKKETF